MHCQLIASGELYVCFFSQIADLRLHDVHDVQIKRNECSREEVLNFSAMGNGKKTASIPPELATLQDEKSKVRVQVDAASASIQAEQEECKVSSTRQCILAIPNKFVIKHRCLGG